MHRFPGSPLSVSSAILSPTVLTPQASPTSIVLFFKHLLMPASCSFAPLLIQAALVKPSAPKFSMSIPADRTSAVARGDMFDSKKEAGGATAERNDDGCKNRE